MKEYEENPSKTAKGKWILAKETVDKKSSQKRAHDPGEGGVGGREVGRR